MNKLTPIERAIAALEAYPFPEDRPVDLMTDFLPDLLLWCAKEKLDFDALLEAARRCLPVCSNCGDIGEIRMVSHGPWAKNEPFCRDCFERWDDQNSFTDLPQVAA